MSDSENTSFRPRVPPLPGYGLPLKQQMRHFFPSALDKDLRDNDAHKARLLALTLREISMLDVMNKVTDKKDWEIKVFDEAISNKWKSEVTGNSDLDFTQRMADHCIDELRYKAGIFKKSGLISVYNGDVIKSDTAIPAELQSSLKKGVAALENVPDRKKDWHPGSNKQVLDLVHPSLFPLAYGVSRILKDDTVGLDDCIPRCGEGEVISKPEEPEPPSRYGRRTIPGPYSTKFQWLPCDIDISGDHPKIVSYINNLHPKYHAELYRTIEDILAKVIPAWNATLTPMKRRNFSRRVEYQSVTYDEEGLDRLAQLHGIERQANESEAEYKDRKYDWRQDHLIDYLVQPEPERVYFPDSLYSSKEVNLKKDYGSSGLQVIVKLANIHLTPENPKYSGGSWHIEGQLNEHICASAIYYYDCENITPSRLAFRQSINVDNIYFINSDHDEDNWGWLWRIFGLQNEDPGIQDVGAVETREGRLITFPNVLQHRVQRMELADPTRPGHRKILALFLVDPNIKVISTANIPCQRRDWWGELVAPEMLRHGKLPIELIDTALEYVEDFPVTLDQAKELREELMEERKAYVLDYQDTNFTGCVISFCEH